MRTFVFLIAGLASSFAVQALPRDKVEVSHFKKANPCPTTGRTKGKCYGYQVDHKKALMVGGADKPSNMQWSKTADHKAKTRADFAECKSGPVCLHRGMNHGPRKKRAKRLS